MRHAGDASSAMATPDARMLDLDRLERVLVSAAVERRPVTYGQVLRYFGRKVTRITVGALCSDLGAVCRRVEAVGGPDLAVLVVRKSDGLPGEGYFRSLRSESGYVGSSTGADARRIVAELQARAFAFYGGREPFSDGSEADPECSAGRPSGSPERGKTVRTRSGKTATSHKAPPA
jgi:hypothetical protein